MSDAEAMTSRRQQLAVNLARVEDRITEACQASGRSRNEVTLVVITKTYPALDVELLADLGVTDVGENRHPEAGDKHDAVAQSAHPPRLRWHFVGGLQTNKAAAVARYADVVHSVDRIKLVAALDKGAAAAGSTLECLVQVGLSDDAGRSGATPHDVLAVAEAIERSEHLTLGGVMAVAPLEADPTVAFSELGTIAAVIRSAYPHATTISAGMSGDLEEAVMAGATHLRIGRSVLGERP
ncbi:MAG: YggS family pyridoxal phosphate-dependent enzyme [Aeromicrobium sp.]